MIARSFLRCVYTITLWTINISLSNLRKFIEFVVSISISRVLSYMMIVYSMRRLISFIDLVHKWSLTAKLHHSYCSFHVIDFNHCKLKQNYHREQHQFKHNPSKQKNRSYFLVQPCFDLSRFFSIAVFILLVSISSSENKTIIVNSVLLFESEKVIIFRSENFLQLYFCHLEFFFHNDQLRHSFTL
jgi:hypothetical protein